MNKALFFSLLVFSIIYMTACKRKTVLAGKSFYGVQATGMYDVEYKFNDSTFKYSKVSYDRNNNILEEELREGSYTINGNFIRCTYTSNSYRDMIYVASEDEIQNGQIIMVKVLDGNPRKNLMPTN